MQMVKKILFFILIVWLGFLIFMPKSELYYAVEKALDKEDIRINERNIQEGLFSLNIDDLDIYVKGIYVAHVKKITCFTLLFYTNIEIEDIVVDDLFKNKIPESVARLDMYHNIISPLKVSLDANGSFGLIKGNISLLSKKVHLDFVEPKEISKVKMFLQKGKKGWFYEKSF